MPSSRAPLRKGSWLAGSVGVPPWAAEPMPRTLALALAASSSRKPRRPRRGSVLCRVAPTTSSGLPSVLLPNSRAMSAGMRLLRF